MLGKCTHHAAPCFRLANRLSHARSTSTHVRVPVGDDLGPTREDLHQTFRARKDQNESDLPLPPLLDPKILNRRSQWEKPKAQPDLANQTPFQKRLQANSFAHALASPVRQCRATLISLPEALLTTLHARPHPETKDPWLLPVRLTTNERHLGPPFHFIGHQTVARHLGTKKQWHRALYARMTEKYGGAGIKKMIWREDLPDLILNLMRKQLLQKLSWNFAFKGRLVPVASPSSTDIADVDNASCVLIFRSLRTQADDIGDRAKDISDEMEKWAAYAIKGFTQLDPHKAPNVTHHPPSWYVEPIVPRFQPRLLYPEFDFKTAIWRGKKIPLYSLTDLLGEEKAREFLAGSKYRDEKCVIIKDARHNMQVQLLLMRLQAYIVQSGT
ncbi:hypothetical protein BKA63DRAFT_13966 [Paraphoma chrysanthemicola]|nr:hypothetical protein BKA63DRAFT_13966 [Paraphoma chrysanthemicola]